jgi:DNA-binding NarL/FixJ family response regulator
MLQFCTQKDIMTKIKFAIVEDEPEIRLLTVQLLNFYKDLECVGAFSDAEQYLAALPKLSTQVVLMDIGLPNRTGIECIQLARAIQPKIDYLMFTNHIESEKVFEALAAGAVGYLLKGCPPEQLAQAIREAQAGGSPMSWQISRLVTKQFERTQEAFPLLESLTEQETNILQDLAKGKSYKEIAKERFISENTVRSHVKNIYGKLQIHTRAEAIYCLLKQNAPYCQCPQFKQLMNLFLN